MKTDYSKEIEDLLNETFIPSTPGDKKALCKTLDDLHEMVIKILPAKWVYIDDVYQVLSKLNFKTYLGKKEDEEGFFYFVSLR